MALNLDYFYGSEADQFSFYRIPKILFTNQHYKTVSLEAKVLYGLLLDRVGLSSKNDWRDADGRVFLYFAQEDVQECLCCGRNKVIALFKELEESGLIERKKQGQGKPANPDGGVYYTNNAGEIVLEGLEPGTTITAQEIKTVDGYVLDGQPQSIKIEAGKSQNLTFWNKKAGSLIIRKLDKLTGKPLAGVEFELVYAEGGYVDTDNGHLSSKGPYTTDAHGEIHISGVTGTIVVKETRPLSGYTIEPGRESQTVTVNPQETQTLTFYL